MRFLQMLRRLSATLLFLAAACLVAGCGKNKFQQEVETEEVAVKLAREVQQGKYELITTEELKELLNGDNSLVLIDAMPYESSFKKEHLAGAKNFLFDKDAKGTEEWDAAASDNKSLKDYEKLLGDDKSARVVVYCGFVKCARSHNAAAWAVKLGYSDVKRYAGGIFAWKGAGYPTESSD